MSSPQGQPATAAPSKSGAKWIVGAAAALALGAAAVVYAKKSTPAKTGAEHAKPKVVVEPSVVDVDPFILNLADAAGDRFFRLHLRLVLDQKEIAQRAAEGLAQAKLRDRVLSLLAKKHAGELTTVEGKERLRSELQAAIEPLLAEPPLHRTEKDGEPDPAPARVTDVLFTEFLVQ